MAVGTIVTGWVVGGSVKDEVGNDVVGVAVGPALGVSDTLGASV